MINYKHTADKIRQFGGKVHPRQKGSDKYRAMLLESKCDALNIAPVYDCEID